MTVVGHGRSCQPWTGNEMDTYTDDLAELIETLELQDAIRVGHSAGGGEVAMTAGYVQVPSDRELVAAEAHDTRRAIGWG